jgi:hypothetical protein
MDLKPLIHRAQAGDIKALVELTRRIPAPRLRPPAASYRLAISFSTDREGEIASLAVPFEPFVRDIVFTRTATRSRYG